MIDEKFVKEIARLATDNEIKLLKDERGCEYFTRQVVANPPASPEGQKICTLDGLVDLVKAEKLKCAAFIQGPRTVALKSEPDPLWKKRDVFAVAEIHDNGFPFKAQLTIEEFIINLQCNFVDTPEKKKIIDLVSSITSSEVTTSDDDGIAQEVVTKASIGHKMSKIQMDPIVSLVPFRTFREIEQPADKFLLRMHPLKEALPMVSLRSAGGELWEYEAITSIYDYLRAALPEEIPVIR